MFHVLGQFVTRAWPVVLVAWIALLAAVLATRPDWGEVTSDGDFAFLPDDAASLSAERQFRGGFDADLVQSNLILVVSRPPSEAGEPTAGAADAPQSPEAADAVEQGEQEGEDPFLTEMLLTRLRSTLVEGGFAAPDLPFADLPLGPRGDGGPGDGGPGDGESIVPPDYPVVQVLTPRNRVIGSLFRSGDGEAELIMLGLRTEYAEIANAPLVAAVEDLVEELLESGDLPAGLELAVSGTAVIGRDRRVAAERSGEATHLVSLALVIGLLLMIYRAPLMAAVPLLTVVAGVSVALGLIALGAERGWFSPFLGLEVYVTVVAYGAGVDYCMFLTARYKEELDAAPAGALAGEPPPGAAGLTPGPAKRSQVLNPWAAALARSVERVGGALTASAGTTIVGIGMMWFAEFSKFQQAGLGIVMGLAGVTIASLTLAPALLSLLGKWAFWPKIPHGRPAASGGWLPAGQVAGAGKKRVRRFWANLAGHVCGSPGRWLLGAFLVMFPLAFVGVRSHDNLTYGLLSELPADAPGVRGAEAVQQHFVPGEIGPVTLVISAPDGPGRDELDFENRAAASLRLIEALSDNLWERREELGLSSVRSVSHPLGTEHVGPLVARGAGGIAEKLKQIATVRALREHYVGRAGPDAYHITSLDVIFRNDPFSRDSMAQLGALRRAVDESLPPELANAEVGVLGATASITDLAEVIDRDRWRVNLLVLGAVFVVLVILLRRCALSIYLLATVVLGYFTTLGITVLLFQFLAWWTESPAGFAGLDWKVPAFLFTILVAVGEDYNIYLVTRVDEERAKERGPGISEAQAEVRGVRSAVAQTGAIITGCGLIMAGTFGSLIAGELIGMVQLGVALTVGVMLDTFLIRPVLVPAYLTMLHSGRFGPLGRLLGAASTDPAGHHHLEESLLMHQPEPGEEWSSRAGTPDDRGSSKELGSSVFLDPSGHLGPYDRMEASDPPPPPKRPPDDEQRDGG